MGLSTEEFKWLHGTLRNIEFMSFLSIGEVERLTNYIFKKTFKKKSVICKQGDKGDFFYLMYKGTVSIWSSLKGAKKTLIATLNQGQYFGEMSLISGDTRNATIIADTDIELFLLFRNDFNALVRGNTGLEQKIKEVISRRQAQREMELSHPSPGKSKGFFSKILEYLGFSS